MQRTLGLTELELIRSIPAGIIDKKFCSISEALQNVLRYKDNVLLVTATMNDPRPGIDFFPLIVDFEEKLYARGKFLEVFSEEKVDQALKLYCQLV